MKNNGFTLVEVIVAILIVAVISSLAIPSYQRYIRRSHRTDGIQTIVAISLAQSRYRSENPSYGDISAVWNGISTSPGGYYNLAISNITPITYTITASAVGNQSLDTQGTTSCSTLTLTINGVNDTRTPTACWQ